MSRSRWSKDFVAGVREKAVGADVLKSVAPGQQVIKIVNDHLVEMLGGETAEIGIAAARPPAAVLMVGLQGSGKTTTTAKAWPLPPHDPQEARADGLARHQPACGHGAAGGAGRGGRRWTCCRSSPARARWRSRGVR